MDTPFYLTLVHKALQQTTDIMPRTFTLNVDYDLIQFEDGYEKPSRDVFYTKYNELLLNQHLDVLRTQRNEKLLHSDFSMLPDHRLSRENIEEWKLYRQSLRDLLSNTVDPKNPVWPDPPDVKLYHGSSTTLYSEELQIEKNKAYELQQKIELLELSHASLIQRLEALENVNV